MDRSLSYDEWVESKRIKPNATGFIMPACDLNQKLFPWQQEITRWSLAKGKSAIFADCGLGKTPMQLEWANQVCRRTGGSVLIVAPLAVSRQTAEIGHEFGIPVTVCRHAADVRPGINITNYEMMGHLSPAAFRGIVLDESSILKNFGGVYRKDLTEFASTIPFRLCATATPAPNDLVEIINHAEFLGIMRGKEMIALWFTQDGNTTHQWRLKGHARGEFWRWMATWCVALRRPSDLGYDDGRFVLPELRVHQETVEVTPTNMRTLFPMAASTLQERLQARRDSIGERVARCADLVNTEWREPWIVWCNLNRESELLTRAIPGAVEVRGSDPPEAKEQAMLDFAVGKIRVLVTKPSIAGHGMNWQHCAREAFVGLSDSWEEYYQAVRRCWRFGQTRPVDVYLITAETEGAVVENIRRKEAQAAAMFDEIITHMQGLQLEQTTRQEAEYEEAVVKGPAWTLFLGDSIKTIDRIETGTVGFSIFSPPFPGMYAYSNSVQDVGNCETISRMIEHFEFLVGPEKLLRVLMPGRICAIHLMQLTAMLSRDGYIGIQDYRGRVIAMMERNGWIYHGEVCIDKNPQVQAVRNKEKGLLFKSLATDSAAMRMALADYLLLFRKPGQNPEPIPAGMSPRYNPGAGWVSEQEWIRWARPVWYSSDWMPRDAIECVITENGTPEARWVPCHDEGIRITDVLNVRQARETDDERHLCPLQIGVVKRGVKLWSAPNDLVYSPFGGVGTEGYVAVELGRRFVGGELKKSYFRSMQANVEEAYRQSHMRPLTLADMLEGTDTGEEVDAR